MLDIIARLLLSAGILVGTTYLPMLSQAVSGGGTATQVASLSPRPCPPTTAPVPGAGLPACLG